MKKLILCILPLISVWGCDCEGDNQAPDCSLTLQLVEMRGTVREALPLTGDDMDWQESIRLNIDATFIKRRVRDGAALEEGGAYTFNTSNGWTYLELTYNTPGNPLMASCTSAEGKELIRVVTPDTQFQGTWGMCDGPTLTYEASSPCERGTVLHD